MEKIKASDVPLMCTIVYDPKNLENGAGHHKYGGYRATVIGIRRLAGLIQFKLTVGCLNWVKEDDLIEIDNYTTLTDVMPINRSSNPKTFKLGNRKISIE